MNIQDFLDRLEGVKERSKNQWVARCTAHDDQRASLCIGIGEDGKILLHCQAGCTVHRILETLGLGIGDLMPDIVGRSIIVAEYSYCDEKGKLLYQSVRFKPKDFRQRKPDGRGGWDWRVKGTRKVPYRLPQLCAVEAGAAVFIVEGEKDADRLAAIGLTATTAAGGAKAHWLDEWAPFFAGKHVIILPDNDGPGMSYAQAAARCVQKKAASVRIIELPDLAEKGDVSDWLDAGHTKADLRAAVKSAVDDGWRRRLLMTSDGAIKTVLPNAVLLMRYLGGCKGRLQWDARYLRAEWTAQGPPWDEGNARPLADADAVEMSRWLGEAEGLAFGTDTLWAVMVAESQRSQIDRVGEYLRLLRWDGNPRIDTWLVDCLGATMTADQCEPGEDLEEEWMEYVRAVGSKWLLSAVARALCPGCQADHMLILEGEQGTLKSSSLAALGGEFYVELALDVESKDAMMNIHGPWIVEWSELAGLSRRESEAVKAFISRRSDRFRPPYGRHAEDVPRRCVFAGTTNESLPLTDGTGNRRYWPVHVRRADPMLVAKVRDQLWAEAVVRYEKGEPWWLSYELEALARVQQEDRLEHDAWEDRVIEIVEEGTLKLRDYVTLADLFDALTLPTSQQTTSTQRRVAKVMRRIGWVPDRRVVRGSRQRGYRRPGRLIEMQFGEEK